MSVPLPSSSTTIVPFWNRLREITRYPAHSSALLTIVILAFCNLAVFLPFGWFLQLLVTVAMYRYAFECLQSTANGHMEPPEMMQSTDGSLGWKLIWLMVIFVIFIAVGVAMLGPVVGIVLMLFLGLSLPGAVMTLAMDESLASALSPAKWIAIQGRIGWPYLAVVGLCVVIMISQGYANEAVSRVLPAFVSLIVVGVIANYALVMTFHLMGYLLYQFHDEVGFEPAAPQMVKALKKPDPDQDVLDEAAELVRGGSPENATELLRGHLRSRGGTPAVHTQYRKLLRLQDNRDELLRHGQEYLNVLMAQEKPRHALELLRECQAIEPTFSPTNADQITELANLAGQGGQADIALRLLSGFHKRFPKSKDIPKNYLLVATLMHERMNQDEKAIALLKQLKATYPGDPLMPEIEQRLGVIERMVATAKKPGAPG